MPYFIKEIHEKYSNDLYLRNAEFVKHNLQIIAVVLLSVIFIITKVYFLNKPFIGIHDWASTDLAIGGSSLLKFGFFNLKGIPVLDVIMPIDGKFSYYCHWPLGIFYLFALGFKIFGIHEWVVRLTVLILSTPTIYLIYLIGQKIHSKNCGMLAAIFISLFPVFSYYSIVGIYESTNLMLCLMMIYFYIKWIDTKDNKYIYYSLIFFIVGANIAWQTYTVVPWLFIHSVINNNRNQKVYLYIVVPFITLLIQAGYIYALMDSNVITTITKTFLYRISMSLPEDNFSLYQYISVISYRLITIIGLIPFCLSFLGLFFREQKHRKDLSLILFFSGITWLIIMKNHCFIHEFTLLYITPFVSILASIGVLSLINRCKSLYKYGLLIVIFSATLFQVLPINTRYFNSNIYETRKEIGVNIEKTTEPDSIIYINIKDNGSHFFEFYSNRYIVYSDDNRLANNKTIYEFNLIRNNDMTELVDQVKYFYLNKDYYFKIEKIS